MLVRLSARWWPVQSPAGSVSRPPSPPRGRGHCWHAWPGSSPGRPCTAWVARPDPADTAEDRDDVEQRNHHGAVEREPARAAEGSDREQGGGTKNRPPPAGHRKTRTEHGRSEEHTSELQSRGHLVCRLLLEKKNTTRTTQRQRRGG